MPSTTIVLNLQFFQCGTCIAFDVRINHPEHGRLHSIAIFLLGHSTEEYYKTLLM
jgi:hypothetical protein